MPSWTDIHESISTRASDLDWDGSQVYVLMVEFIRRESENNPLILGDLLEFMDDVFEFEVDHNVFDVSLGKGEQ